MSSDDGGGGSMGLNVDIMVGGFQLFSCSEKNIVSLKKYLMFYLHPS